MKKIFALILALVMVMGLAVSASAATITINPNLPEDGSSAGETYKAYKIFTATFEGDTLTADTAVSYTIDSTSPFYSVIENHDAFELEQVNNSTTWNVKKVADYDAAELATSLKAVIADTTEVAGSTNTMTDGKYVIKDLDKGYYLITSTLGSKMVVDTLGTAEVETKNAYPSLTKKIVENNSLVDSITANYGETITFKITVNIPATVNCNIIIHDTLDEDMTYVGLTEGTAGVSKIENCNIAGCNDIHFEIDYDEVAKDANGDFAFTYTATLNTNAATATPHTNVANLTYSAFTSTDTAEVSVYTYKFDLVKTEKPSDTNAASKNILSGAKFKLQTATTTGEGETASTTYTDINLIKTGDNAYRVAKPDETGTTEIVAGNVTISGLANGTYYLEETEAPAGYNKLTARQSVTIENGNLDATLVDGKYQSGGVEVENSTGSELPSTGGMGTTIFYVVGGLLTVGAVVLLVTKKRMSV